MYKNIIIQKKRTHTQFYTLLLLVLLDHKFGPAVTITTIIGLAN